MRSLDFALVLAALLACNPSDPGTTETSNGTGTATTTGTTAGTTAPTGDLTTTGGTATGGTATGGMTTAPTTSTSTTSTTEPATSTTEPATSTTTTSTTVPGTSTTDDTGAVDPQCAPATGDYGECAAIIGWAFDGTDCTLRSGCGCEPDCDKFFPTAEACALSCAAADHCNSDEFDGAGLAEPPIMPGMHCDGVYMCPGDDDGLKQAYQAIFGQLTCEPGDFPCSENGEHCMGLLAGTLGPDEWAKMCAASLLPGSGPFICTVFGP
ncbi:hypothetical protein SAMN02745121_03849 [Nannocystis exedens]|uniref:Uncharacterized protein n=1 Tax=Nannocystis exedens TaxID=54 RepID=A0A1I1ZQ86_9BACT|nr:hypothetical protein [Nannocystis exedens]PCC75425.1 hypothetical protein NAEX_08535 [Nannocystis exedens]SFE32763.1 hypothetical protein SAMN02745121_03849 [Nannocystis exedens]